MGFWDWLFSNDDFEAKGLGRKMRVYIMNKHSDVDEKRIDRMWDWLKSNIAQTKEDLVNLQKNWQQWVDRAYAATGGGTDMLRRQALIPFQFGLSCYDPYASNVAPMFPVNQNPIPVLPDIEQVDMLSRRALYAHFESIEGSSTPVLAAAASKALSEDSGCSFATAEVEIITGQPYTTFFGRRMIRDPVMYCKTVRIRRG